MSGRYTLTPRAEADLDKIWTDTAQRWTVDQAEDYIRQIGRHMTMLANRPLIGRPCFDLRQGYYKYPSGSHVLFYRLVEGGIDIVRILHERMDVKRHL